MKTRRNRYDTEFETRLALSTLAHLSAVTLGDTGILWLSGFVVDVPHQLLKLSCRNLQVSSFCWKENAVKSVFSRSVLIAAVLCLLGILAGGSAVAQGQLLGTYNINYRYNAAGYAPSGSPNDGNPYYNLDPIGPGPYFVNADPGQYKIVVTGYGAAGPSVAYVWSGDAASGTRLNTPRPGNIGDSIVFTHTHGQIVFYYWDWYDYDNPDTISVTVELYRLSALDAPTNLTVTPVSSTKLDLTWDYRSDPIDGFTIERKDGDVSSTAPFQEIARITDPTKHEFSDSGLSRNTTYTYHVRAFKGSDYSNYSTPDVSGTTWNTSNGIDLSNVAGVPASDWWQGVSEAGINWVVVDAWGGGSSPSEGIYAGQQLQAARDSNMGFSLGAYCTLKFNSTWTGAQQVAGTLGRIGAYGDLRFIAVAVDDAAVLYGNESPAQRIWMIKDAVEAIRSVGRQPIIYHDTNAWSTWIDDTDAFSFLPWWRAEYDNSPQLDSQFGKQYAEENNLGNDDIGHHTVDLDTFDPSRLVEGPRPVAPRLLVTSLLKRVGTKLVATVTIKNQGSTIAYYPRITTATLSGVGTETPLPAYYDGWIASGDSRSLQFTFPGSTATRFDLNVQGALLFGEAVVHHVRISPM